MAAPQRFDRLLLALLGLSLTANVSMALWARARVLQSPERGSTVQVGSTLAPLKGTSEDGRDVALSYGTDSRPVVLYVFSPSCQWCQRNAKSVAALFRAARERYRFVGLSLSSRGGRQEVLPRELPVIYATERVPFHSTPQTLVVGQNGRVLRAWPGAYQGAVKREIEAYFATTLPSLDMTSHAG